MHSADSGPHHDSDGEVLSTTNGATSCPDGCDGSVSVAFTCSEPPCTIAWADGQGNDLGQNANTLTGLCPGDYFVTVVNGTGCISIDTASVIAPPNVQANISTIPVDCTGACTGSANVGVVGGTPPYTFLWDPPPAAGQGTPLATGLCCWRVQPHHRLRSGCDTTVSILILEPLSLTVDAVGQDISLQCQL